MTSSPRRVVVLGSTGFVGSHIARRAVASNFPVVEVSSSVMDLTRKASIQSLRKLIRETDCIVHSAAVAPTKNTGDFIKNLEITDNVVEALREQPVEHLILVSSDAVYGSESGVVTEESPLCPDSLHGAMSLARELVMEAANVNTKTILRPTSIYGPGDTHNSYGPNRFVREGLSLGIVEVFGAGGSVRDHIFIDDVADVALASVQNPSTTVLNVASGQSLSFTEVANLVAASADDDWQIRHVGSETTTTFRYYDQRKITDVFPDVHPRGLAEALPIALARDTY